MKQTNKLFYCLSLAFVCILFNIVKVNAQTSNRPLNSQINLMTAFHPFSILSNQAGNFTVGYGSANLPSSFFEASYSPKKHINVQGNYTIYDEFQTIDYVTKIGIGTYYFIPTRKNKPKLISEKWGQATGFAFNFHIGYLNGLKRFKFDNNPEYVLAKQSRAKYNGFATEVGIHFNSVASKFQLLLSRNSIKYNTIDLSDSGMIADSFWHFVDYVNEHNKFNLYTISFRYSLGIKQGSIYYNITTPVDGWGNTDFIIAEIFPNSFRDFNPNFKFGINLNIDKIFKNKNWQLNKVFKMKKSIDE